MYDLYGCVLTIALSAHFQIFQSHQKKVFSPSTIRSTLLFVFLFYVAPPHANTTSSSSPITPHTRSPFSDAVRA